MSPRWVDVLLGDVLRRVERPQTPLPGTTYRQLGVRLWGEGAYERERLDGAATKYSSLSQVRAGDVVVNKIWARNGSVAVVQEALDGCFVSGEFPTFAADSERLLPRWMHWLTKTEEFWQQCDQKSRGTSGKNRIKPEQFLRIEIPLPPLAEQQRVVKTIEAMASRVAEACSIRVNAFTESDALLTAARRTAIASCEQSTSLEEVCLAIIDNLHSNPRLSESGVPCIRSSDVGWGGLNLNSAQRTDEEEYRRRTVRGEPQADDVVLVREGGGTGKCAVVVPGQRFSLGQRVMMLRPDPAKILPRFLLHQLLSPFVQEEQIEPMTKGSASPHLNIAALKRFNIRLPRLEEQRQIVSHLDTLQDRVHDLQCVQAETAKELDALLPAILDSAFNGEL